MIYYEKEPTMYCDYFNLHGTDCLGVLTEVVT